MASFHSPHWALQGVVWEFHGSCAAWIATSTHLYTLLFRLVLETDFYPFSFLINGNTMPLLSINESYKCFVFETIFGKLNLYEK